MCVCVCAHVCVCLYVCVCVCMCVHISCKEFLMKCVCIVKIGTLNHYYTVGNYLWRCIENIFGGCLFKSITSACKVFF